jgi:hypothetical protein
VEVAVIDPAVVAVLDADGRVDVIVTFVGPRPAEALAGFDVRRVFPAIAAVAMRLDDNALQRLLDDPGVVAVELDGEVSALD